MGERSRDRRGRRIRERGEGGFRYIILRRRDFACGKRCIHTIERSLVIMGDIRKGRGERG